MGIEVGVLVKATGSGGGFLSDCPPDAGRPSASCTLDWHPIDMKSDPRISRKNKYGVLFFIANFAVPNVPGKMKDVAIIHGWQP